MNKPQLNTAHADKLVLDILKRSDPHIDEILTQAHEAGLYRWSNDQQKWEQQNIEGAVYICKRNTQPRFQFFILNRKGTENWKAAIDSGMQYTIDEKFHLLSYLRSGETSQILGIWVKDPEEFRTLAAVLRKITHTLPGAKEMRDQARNLVEQPQAQQAQPTAADAAAAAIGNGEDGRFWDTAMSEQQVRAGVADREGLNGVTNAVAVPTAVDVQQAMSTVGAVGDLARLFQHAATVTRRPDAPQAAAAAPMAVPNAAQPQLPLLTPQQLQEVTNAAIAAAPNAHTTVTAPPARAEDHSSISANPLQQIFKAAAIRQPNAAMAVPAAAGNAPQQTGDASVRSKLKQALAHIVQQDEFINLVLKELQAAGLTLQ